MQRWRKVVFWLVLLWLPAQGHAAAFMSFACHKHHAASAVVSTGAGDHCESHAHGAHHEATAPDESMSHELACHDCSECQLSMTPALPATSSKDSAPFSGDVNPTTASQIQSFIPTLPHRPPRALFV